MGRAGGIVLCAMLLIHGCGGPAPRPRSLYQERWDDVSGQLCVCPPPSCCPKPPAALLGTDEFLQLRSVAEQRAAAVVHVRTVVHNRSDDAVAENPSRMASSRDGGAGVVIARAGLILTSAHVLRNARVVEVVLPNGTTCPVRAVAVDCGRDLAVLRIDASELAALGRSDSGVRPGGLIVAVGRLAAGQEVCARPGVVTAASASLQRTLDPTGRAEYEGLIESTAAIEPGFSGGPLLDQEGRLIGLNVAVWRSGELQRAYAIRLDAATWQAIQRLVEQASMHTAGAG